MPRTLALSSSLGILLMLTQSACFSEPKEGCIVGASFYEHGTQFLSRDGCNGSSCEDGKVSSTLVGCFVCSDARTEAECNETSCTWLAACGAAPAACRATSGCESNADCALQRFGSRCEERTLATCDTVGKICEPPSCWRARITPAGACVGPDDSAYDASCCDLESRCTDSGGTWDTDSCGHYECGVTPGCSATIPGCDCGDGRTYAEGIGCVQDRDCFYGSANSP